MSVTLICSIVSDTQENFIQQQQFLTRISEAYGAEIQGLTKQFTQFYVSAKDKISGTEIQNIFESITKAGASMGLSVESQERAFLALNQMMSKGTIQAEELRGQLGEALPGAFGIMAKAMGVTEKQLGKMMKDGDVLAKDVLPRFAKQLEITYGIENVKRIDNITNAQNRLTNSWTALVATFSESDGILSKSVSGAMNTLASMLTVFNELAKSQAQQRSDELKKIASDEEKKTVIVIEAMRKRGDKEDEIQSYITKKLEQEEAKRLDLFLKAERLQDDIKSSRDDKDIERYKKELTRINTLIAKKNGYIQGLRKFLTPESADTSEEDDKKRKEREKREEDRLKKVYSNRKKELELELYAIDQTLNNDEALYNDRLTALELHRTNRLQILALQFKEEMRLAKGDMELQKSALLDFHRASLEDIEDYSKKREALEKTALQPIGIQNTTKANEDLAKSAKNATDEFEKQQKAMADTDAILKSLKDAMHDYLEGFQSDFMGNLGLPTLFQIMNDEIVGFGDNWAVTFNAMTEVAQEAFNAITQMQNDRYQNAVQNLQQEKEIALAFAGENIAGREEIERQYEQRRKELERKKAQQAKETAKFNIIIDTAQAVVGALAEQNYAGAILFGVLGAAQLALVSNQPIPEYYTGTDNAKEGLAWTQEKGREIITDKLGRVKSLGSDKGATLTKMERGDKVFTASESALMFDNGLNNMLLNKGISMTKVDVNNNGALTDNQVKSIVGAIKNKETTNINIDKSGLNTFVRDGHTTKQIVNNRVRGIGKTV